jgi:uncharacterized integral membrane protein
VRYPLVALVAVAIVIFTLQNTQAVTITLLAWRFGEVPLAAVALGAFGMGVLVAGVPLGIQRWRLRSRLRACQSHPAPPADPTRDG